MTASRMMLIEKHMELLRKKYPIYVQKTDNFLANNPNRDIQENINLNLLLYGKKRILYIVNEWEENMEMTGGTSLHIKDIILSNKENNIASSQDASLKLDSEVNSLEVPVLIGYHIIKEGPYGMSVKFGPKGIYHYKSDYTLNSSVVSFQHEKDNIPYAINFVSAIGVTIGRLFLDFSYEFGLHSVRSDFTYTDVLTGETGTASLSQRTNKLCFSLGFIF